MQDHTPEEERRFLADCRLRSHGWARFQAGNRRAAERMARRASIELDAVTDEPRTNDPA